MFLLELSIVLYVSYAYKHFDKKENLVGSTVQIMSVGCYLLRERRLFLLELVLVGNKLRFFLKV